jgi:hypothetical protein
VPGRELDVHAGVVLQVAAHLGHVRGDVDAVAAQLAGVPDAGQHQQLWRVVRPGADDDLPLARDGGATDHDAGRGAAGH